MALVIQKSRLTTLRHGGQRKPNECTRKADIADCCSFRVRTYYIALPFPCSSPPFTPMDRTSAELAQQLSLLLGRTVQHKIRKTSETPPRVSIIDVLVVITGQDANVSAKSLARLAKRHPEVTPNWCDLAFSGRGQKKTPVTGVKGIVVSGASKNTYS